MKARRFRNFATALSVAALLPAGAAFAETTLRVVGHAALKMLDPVNTTAYITRNHGYFIYDTLFSIDDSFAPQPQMVDTWAVSADGLTYSFTLREGLAFHNGASVTAEDCIASIQRWAQRDAIGKRMAKHVEAMTATGATSFEITLSSKFGALIDGFAKPSSLPLFIMPADIAATPASEQIKTYIGSGPFKFVADD
ncbi:MAG: ABC transporter substrate-binding protein, partial [Pseudodonghicola sp.]